ncbi:hypothetical protein SARC_00118 [Sphaeroforma arctica JP610]|uniref:Uncharacterized protein n=1 Tax=Sphaeroforma arctica JP610 TaxID=667725 RepID=A0A0L0GG95_9EUKA|nr:hypothetical protein SARC_00118 [Sphaeroforma arctica JP610]KNC87861.1 hypothetical protein SARC_00118 [Sphaeroforma arctica JP610]|eukprot:XP_014161763.1 hypothetical protein SARC_00118 [Sphaeroforma arctica JP610]
MGIFKKLKKALTPGKQSKDKYTDSSSDDAVRRQSRQSRRRQSSIYTVDYNDLPDEQGNRTRPSRRQSPSTPVPQYPTATRSTTNFEHLYRYGSPYTSRRFDRTTSSKPTNPHLVARVRPSDIRLRETPRLILTTLSDSLDAPVSSGHLDMGMFRNRSTQSVLW